MLWLQYLEDSTNSLFLDQVQLSPFYFRDLSPFEVKLKANVKTPEEYRQKRMEAFPWTETEKHRLRKQVGEADDHVKALIKSWDQWNTEQRNIQPVWKLAKLRKQYEFGFPHTLDDVIFLPEKQVSTSVLVHEQIHILQRLYPQLFARLYQSLGLHPIYLPVKPSNWITNPDVDQLWALGKLVPFYGWNGKSIQPYTLDLETGNIETTTMLQPNESLAYEYESQKVG